MRVAATTAVVAGTAGAVHHHQDQKYAQKDAAATAAVCGAERSCGAADAGGCSSRPTTRVWPTPRRSKRRRRRSTPAAPAPDLTAQLQQLAQLHDAGVLDDAEFAAAKQKLLAG